MTDGSKKVLLLNQDSKLQQYLANFIPLLGNFEIEEAPHLISGLAKTNAYRPELLIYNLDIRQAHARNIFLDELKAKHPNTKILVVASNKDEKSEIKKMGVKNVLVKPFDLTDLSKVVKKLLPKAVASAVENARLLIADDEPEIGEFLEENFSKLGMEVYIARDGLDALQLFKKRLCNLAILDVKMPFLSGLELIKEFSSSSNPPSPKDIILMTAALGDSLPELKRLGYPIAEKPLDIPALEDKIVQDCEKFHLALKKG